MYQTTQSEIYCVLPAVGSLHCVKPDFMAFYDMISYLEQNPEVTPLTPIMLHRPGHWANVAGTSGNWI